MTRGPTHIPHSKGTTSPTVHRRAANLNFNCFMEKGSRPDSGVSSSDSSWHPYCSSDVRCSQCSSCGG